MNFGNFFPKIGTWSASSNLFVRWFLEVVSILLLDNTPAVKKPLLVLSPPPKNDTTAEGVIALKIRKEGKKFRQYASALSATVGPWLAWMSPAMSILLSLTSKIKITPNQESWVGFLIDIGAIFRSIPTGKYVEIFGRKPIIFYFTIPFITSWTITYFATDVWMLYVARLIAGSVIFTFASSQLVNRAGRRVLLLISDSVMAICLGTLAYYFWLQEYGVDESSFNLIPLISLGVYISTFALGYGSIPGVMTGELFSPEFKGLAIGIVCVLAALIEFCVVKTYRILFEAAHGYQLADVKACFAAVFPPSGVVDSPEPREVAVADAPCIIEARLSALEDAARSLLVANASRTTEARLDALEEAVRSLSAQFAAFTANRVPTNHAEQARTVTPSRWCYYHVRYGSNAWKCGSDQCTFAPTLMKNPSK